jgi:heme exporter protein CcmD
MSAEFWSMGGYAFFVWGSYAAGLAVFAWNVLMPHLHRKTLLKKLRNAQGGDA